MKKKTKMKKRKNRQEKKKGPNGAPPETAQKIDFYIRVLYWES